MPHLVGKQFSTQVNGKTKGTIDDVDWNDIQSILDIARAQTEENYVAIFSLRDNSGSWYTYYLQPLGFSPEALEQSEGRLQLFLYELVPDSLNSVPRIAVATIPDGQKAFIEKQEWILPIVGETQKQKMDDFHCSEYLMVAPAASVCWIGGCTEYDPIFECVDGGSDGGGSSSDNYNWPTSTGDGGGSSSNDGGNNSCPPPYYCGNPDEAPVEDDSPQPDSDPTTINLNCETNTTEVSEAFPDASDETVSKLVEVINANAASFGINTKEELQHFLAQAANETGGFIDLDVSENLNYTSENRLMEVWPSRFSTSDDNKRDPGDYTNDPEKLANFVYANRMGNGNEESGDGYRYRGRGIFQLTGKSNYQEFSDYYQNTLNGNEDIVSNPDLLNSDSELAIKSALWFFKEKVLDTISITDSTTVEEVTKKVNGGMNGLDDRESNHESAKDSLEECDN